MFTHNGILDMGNPREEAALELGTTVLKAPSKTQETAIKQEERDQ